MKSAHNPILHWSVDILLILTAFFISPAALAAPSFHIKNDSSFYLHSKNNGPGCPSLIAPGSAADSTEYWCGYIACAGKDYDDNQGCLEQNSDRSGLTQGGYATWFSLSFGNTPAYCQVGGAGDPASFQPVYQCAWDPATGSLTFAYRSNTELYSAGDNQGQAVALPHTITAYSTGPSYRGVNVSGLEYDGTLLDALFQHPDLPDVRYFAEQGMNTVRLPIRWEFLLSTDGKNLIESTDPSSPFVNTLYGAAIQDTVKKYLDSGLSVVLDLHNYMRFCGAGTEIGQSNEPTDPVANNCQVVTAAQLKYIWGVLADTFAPLAKQYPETLMFELMNEPFTDPAADDQHLDTQALFNAEVEAIKILRAKGITQWILLSGNHWDSLHGWLTEQNGTGRNGDIFTAANLKAAGIDDLSHIAIDVHQYLDSDWSGRHETCQPFSSDDDFRRALNLDSFAAWLKTNHMKAFLGEFGAADNPACQQDLVFLLNYVNDHAYDANKPDDGGFIGWTAWRANRHGGNVGFSPFNYLQASDNTVYGGNGKPPLQPDGTGITQGPGNGLMDAVFSKYLKRPLE